MPDGDPSHWISYQELNELHDPARVARRDWDQHASDQVNVTAGTDALSLLQAIRETVDTLIAPICTQLERERERAESAEKELEGLQSDLVKAHIEAAALRCQLEQACSKPPPTRWARLLGALGHTKS